MCQPLLVGDHAAIVAALDHQGLEPAAFEIIDPSTHPQRKDFEATLAVRLDESSQERISELAATPSWFAGLLTAAGAAAGAVMGAEVTTGHTVQVALRTIGLAPGTSLLSSCFLMVLADGRELIYSDGGVVPEPSSSQLAQIAVAAAASCRALTAEEPRVALLSFSTLGSAEHPAVERVRRAVGRLERMDVDFAFDGELQADAALVPEVAARKAPRSDVAGRANVLVFPSLDAANIAYKLTERLAGARAIGPLLQGTASPIHDLSRGCSSADIVDVLTVTAAAAVAREDL